MMLVEHDMDAVFTLADQLTVMVNGQVIASGTPAAVRADRDGAVGLPRAGGLKCETC